MEKTFAHGLSLMNKVCIFSSGCEVTHLPLEGADNPAPSLPGYSRSSWMIGTMFGGAVWVHATPAVLVPVPPGPVTVRVTV
jgi:hypothetical protein